jgi:hypothetical protein
VWLMVKTDCRDPKGGEASGPLFDFFLIFDVLLEN